MGGEARLDLADVALHRTDDRGPFATVRSDDATVWGSGAYVELESEWSSRVRTVLGLRGDLHRFDVAAGRDPNSGTATDGIVSPKASVVFTAREGTELYVSGGFGYHSNDARGAVQSVDPASGEPVEPVDPLVRSRGAEVGVRTTPLPGWRSTFTGWMVELDSELLFVGDTGSPEPSRASRRFGLTWTNFYRVTPRLTADLDVSFARARFHEASAGENRIPGALENVVTAGVSWEPEESGPFAALRLRHFGEYPMIEDNSARASPTSLVNLNVGWVLLGGLRAELSVLNVLDEADSDVQYYYASRLRGEPPGGVEDVHFHPAEPRQLRVSVGWGL